MSLGYDTESLRLAFSRMGYAWAENAASHRKIMIAVTLAAVLYYASSPFRMPRRNGSPRNFGSESKRAISGMVHSSTTRQPPRTTLRETNEVKLKVCHAMCLGSDTYMFMKLNIIQPVFRDQPRNMVEVSSTSIHSLASLV